MDRTLQSDPLAATWHIDTIDPRAGLAFASWRVNDLLGDGELSTRPLYHLAPPAFSPVQVANPATALTAERFGFQLGLFDEDGEMPFDDLGDVAEFVRRAYLSSGRADDPEGGEPSPVPAPRPDGPLGRVPEVERFGEDDRGFGHLIQQFASRKTPRGHSEHMSWVTLVETSTKDGRTLAGLPLILAGARLTLLELVSRFPGSGDSEKLFIWHQSAIRLATTLIRMGIVREIARRDRFDNLQSYLAEFLESATRSFWGAGIKASYRGENLLWRTIGLMYGIHPERWPYELSLTAHHNAAEPMDDLASLPIALRHASHIHSPDPARSSLADLLSATLAAPELMVKDSELQSLSAFAAARVVCFEGMPWIAGPRWAPYYWPGRSYDDARLALLCNETYAWLACELPDRSFSSSLEEMIANPTSESQGTGEVADAHRFSFHDTATGARLRPSMITIANPLATINAMPIKETISGNSPNTMIPETTAHTVKQ